MGSIVIDIWEKSIFWGAIGSQKDAKNAEYAPLPFVGLNVNLKSLKLCKNQIIGIWS